MVAGDPGAVRRRWTTRIVLALAALLVVVGLFYRLRGNSFQWQLFLDTLSHVNVVWLVAVTL